MLKYNGELLNENHSQLTVSGHDFFYNILFPKNVVKYLEGKDCICISASLNKDVDNKTYLNILHIGYYNDVKNFFENKDMELLGVQCFLFKNVKNEKEADEIIKEINADNSKTYVNLR